MLTRATDCGTGKHPNINVYIDTDSIGTRFCIRDNSDVFSERYKYVVFAMKPNHLSVTVNTANILHNRGPFHKSSYERFLLYEFVEPECVKLWV